MTVAIGGAPQQCKLTKKSVPIERHHCQRYADGPFLPDPGRIVRIIGQNLAFLPETARRKRWYPVLFAQFNGVELIPLNLYMNDVTGAPQGPRMSTPILSG